MSNKTVLGHKDIWRASTKVAFQTSNGATFTSRLEGTIQTYSANLGVSKISVDARDRLNRLQSMIYFEDSNYNDSSPRYVDSQTQCDVGIFIDQMKSIAPIS